MKGQLILGDSFHSRGAPEKSKIDSSKGSSRNRSNNLMAGLCDPLRSFWGIFCGWFASFE